VPGGASRAFAGSPRAHQTEAPIQPGLIIVRFGGISRPIFKAAKRNLNMKPAVSLDFETLVELYYPPIFTFAVRLCGGLEQALELTQQTFCQALNHKSYWGGTQRAKAWLFTLLFREFLKQRRKDSETASTCGPSRPGSTPVLNAMAKMRKGLRDPLVLFYAQDFSFSQIADYLGISLETVLRLLAKGREALRFALVPSGTRSSRLPTCLPARIQLAETWPMAA